MKYLILSKQFKNKLTKLNGLQTQDNIVPTGTLITPNPNQHYS